MMNDSSQVPFLDLITPHRELEEELVAAFREALSGARFIGGPNVDGFEAEFAQFCDSPHCVGVGSGTDALRFALMAVGVQPGDVAVTVPNTFIATTESISQAGALPEFVDIDPRTCNLDPQRLSEYLEACSRDQQGRLLSPRSQRPVTAIVPVHLYGQPADMDSILEVAQEYGLRVVEDAAQAHGAEYYSRKRQSWLKAGSMGHAAAFSFYPGKNLGACGEAGAVTCADAETAARIRMIRDHGQAKKYYHDLEGYNGRLDAIQAAFLRIKLRRLAGWNEQRRQAACDYGQLLTDTEGLRPPHEPEWTRSVYHLYVVHLADREGLQKHLADKGVFCGLHYPLPLHLQKAYSHLGHAQGDFPHSERSASELLSLPMFPGLRREQQERVAELIQEYLQSNPVSA